MKLYKDAVIFAGGKSSRMGEDKALLPFATYTSLAAYQQERLQKLFHTVYISAKKNKFDFKCLLITDNYEASSPLVGILSIFETHKTLDEVFILSVDAPFVDKTVIERIIQSKHEAFDVVVAKSPNGIQPLCGLYKRSILPLAQQQYKENNHKLQDLLDIVKTKHVEFNDNRAFINLNHPKEYKEALALSLSTLTDS